MQVMIDYNGWRKMVDVDDYTVRRGKIQLRIMPPLSVNCLPLSQPTRPDPVLDLIVYATGCQTEHGLMIFSNRV